VEGGVAVFPWGTGGGVGTAGSDVDGQGGGGGVESGGSGREEEGGAAGVCGVWRDISGAREVGAGGEGRGGGGDGVGV